MVKKTANQSVNRQQRDLAWLQHLNIVGFKFDPTLEEIHPGSLHKAVNFFNQGDFRNSHEHFEKIWLETRYPERLVYYALTKLSAGLLQHENGKFRSSIRQVETAIAYLEPFTPKYRGMDIHNLVISMKQFIRFQLNPSCTTHQRIKIIS